MPMAILWHSDWHASQPCSRVQFIGYAIHTAPGQSTPSWWQGWVPNPPGAPPGHNYQGHLQKQHTYLGNTDADADLIARCNQMKAAMDQAASSASLDRSRECAKVFVAPEFFFRGAEGAYQMQDVAKIIERLQALGSDSAWRQWIFVYGSIIGCAQKSDGSYEVYNITLVQQGGMGRAGCFVVMKEHKSGIDFVRTGGHWQLHSHPFPYWDEASLVRGLSDQMVEHAPPARPSGPSGEVQKLPDGGECLVEVNGINIAVEICLDHAAKRMVQSPLSPGDLMVQLQIVPSAGMTIQPDSVVVGDGGLVFNCDGLSDLSGTPATGTIGAHTQLMRVALGQSNARTLTDVPRSVRTTVSGPGGYFAKGTGAVDVFPAQPLPGRRRLMT